MAREEREEEVEARGRARRGQRRLDSGEGGRAAVAGGRNGRWKRNKDRQWCLKPPTNFALVQGHPAGTVALHAKGTHTTHARCKGARGAPLYRHNAVIEKNMGKEDKKQREGREWKS